MVGAFHHDRCREREKVSLTGPDHAVAERLIMTADRAAKMLVWMMDDTEVPFGVRANIAQDLLDRAGLVATQVHQIVPTTEDPIMRFFEGAFSDPSNWESNPQADLMPAIESYATTSCYRHDDEPEEIVEAELVEPEGEPANGTPPRIAEMIKAGGFHRRLERCLGSRLVRPNRTIS